MNTSTEILRVPEKAALRNLMRVAARNLVIQENIKPPARLKLLEVNATLLLEENDISQDYFEFAMVLIGNETWRNTMATIPFSRRLLLIPQCLKNSSLCKAKVDDFGLLCEGCRSCSIDGILETAEELGYATLVAEGTSAAVSLVEEGAIDGVIGVSCLPVLQKSFDPVSRAAIPVMGLPLLYDGCVDTKVDRKWLIEEIGFYNENEINRPISLSLLKKKTLSYFSDEKLKECFPGKTYMEKLAFETMTAGGHRMRPLLAVLGHEAYAISSDAKLEQTLALIIECFHKASLIHDDIEDDADHRYHKETLHKRYGIPIAINAGDYLIGKGYQLITEIDAEPKLIAQCLKLVADSHVKLTEGQGDDISLSPSDRSFGKEDAVRMFKLKTGESAKVALLLGAVTGGASKEEIELLSEFADHFGVAYQIRDDLNEYKEENEMEKIHDFPFLLALLNDYTSTHSESAELTPDQAIENVIDFREKILQFGLIQEAEVILDSFIDNCYSVLDNLTNQKLRLSLYGVVGKIFNGTISK